MSFAILSMMVLGGCGGSTNDKKDRKATFSELYIEDFSCQGLTNNGKNLICGTSDGDLMSIDPYTGKTKLIYKLNRSLNGLAYLGDDKYLLKEDSYEGIGIIYSFDIHKKLKDTLNIISSFNGGGLVYDQEREMIFLAGNYLDAIDLDGNDLASAKIYTASAMGQTDKYVYITGYDSNIQQYSKDNILNEIYIPFKKSVFLDYNNGYFSGRAWGISGMTILHGEVFIYYRGDGRIHKLDVDLADYGDSGPHF
jgi:hypothetical protein